MPGLFTGYLKYKGFFLIETCLVMFLGMMILNIFFGLYFFVQHNNDLQSALEYMRENSWRAIHILKTEIKNSGYLGCVYFRNKFPIHCTLDYLTPKNELEILGKTLVVKHAAVKHGFLKSMKPNELIIYGEASRYFNEGDFLIISNCKHADIFTVKKIVQIKEFKIITPANPIDYNYSPFANVAHFEINKFFIAITDRKNADGTKISSLFMRDINNQKIELVENVEDIQFESYNTNKTPSLIRIKLLLKQNIFKKYYYFYVAL